MVRVIYDSAGRRCVEGTVALFTHATAVQFIGDLVHRQPFAIHIEEFGRGESFVIDRGEIANPITLSDWYRCVV